MNSILISSIFRKIITVLILNDLEPELRCSDMTFDVFWEVGRLDFESQTILS